MYEIEFLVFILCGYLLFRFFRQWYGALSGVWPGYRNTPAKVALHILPLVALVIIVYTLRVLASFDVVGDFIYIIFYIVMGYAWVYLGLVLVFYFLDLSWRDDVVHLGNKAALPVLASCYMALTLIYSGANIGDGPGWWCIFVAGGLGVAAWLALAYLMHRFTGVIERVTVERDVACGVRFGSYLLASGIILARASAGDWTSFTRTVVEFLDGWPVLLLTALAMLVESLFMNGPQGGRSRLDAVFGAGKKAYRRSGGQMAGSVLLGAIYIIAAIAVVFLLIPPVSNNPQYIPMYRVFTGQRVFF